MLLPKCLLVRRKSYSSRWTIAFSSAFVIGFFTHFTDDVVVSLLISSHYRAFSATAGAICLQSVHICIPTKKKDPYRFSVRAFLLLFLKFPNLNIQIPGFSCIVDDGENHVPVTSGKATAKTIRQPDGCILILLSTVSEK